MTNNGSVSATITDSLIDSNRKIQYNASLNADAGLIPTNDYDLSSKKYVDDSINNHSHIPADINGLASFV